MARQHLRCAVGVVVASSIGLSLVATAPASAAVTTRVSVSTGGAQADRTCEYPSASADGRYVAFQSYAGTLVSGDTNSYQDIFVHDRQTGQTTRVSVSSGGAQADKSCYYPSISGNGRYVVFYSSAGTLVSGDNNAKDDVFIHDRQTDQTELVSVGVGGAMGNNSSRLASVSSDGRYVAFESYASNMVAGDSNGMWDIFVRDRQTGQTSLVSVGTAGQSNNNSHEPSINASGRYVAYESLASNHAGVDTNGQYDIFVRDLQAGQTTRVSVATGGAQAATASAEASISEDGRYVAFKSAAGNLVSGDTNACADIFVHDRQTSQTTRVSVATSGQQADSDSQRPCMSGDGRYVAFECSSGYLVPNDTNARGDIFLRDLQEAKTTRVSVASDGTQADSTSYAAAVSSTGRYIAISSNAGNLVAGDTNGAADVFVRDREGGPPFRPDAMLRGSDDASYRGRDVYNVTGAGQRSAQTVAVGAKAVYKIRVQNDGTAGDRFGITGPGGSSAWQVRYFDRPTGGFEITAEVTGGGWMTSVVAPRATCTFRLEVKPKSAAAAGTSKVVLVKATSVGESTVKDAVKAVTTAEGGTAVATIGALAASPTPTGTDIVLTLSSPAAVDAAVLNLAGRPVRALCRGQAFGAGTQRLLWNGQSDAGLPVPAGVYLVRVAACAGNGARSEALTKLVLTRR